MNAPARFSRHVTANDRAVAALAARSDIYAEAEARIVTTRATPARSPAGARGDGFDRARFNG